MAHLAASLLAGVCIALAVSCWPRRAVRRAPGGAGEARRPGPATVRDVANAMDLLALALESGASVPSCLERVARECDGRIADHLQQVSAALQWGVEPRAAWSDVPQVWAPAGSALTLADAAGTPPAGLVRDAARRLRESEQHRLELAGATVAVRLVVPLGLCFLPAFFLLTVVPVVVAMASELLR